MLGAEDFAALLSGLTARVAFVNAASSSGGFVPVLSGAGRAIVTATRSARERNATVFARFFVDAFVDGAADVDKDERISVLEAFRYATAEVTRYYESDGRLLTEHALLDDNGDGEGSGAPDLQTAESGELSEAGDGAWARRFLLGATLASASTTVAGAAANESPEVVSLTSQRQSLQDRLDELRRLRDQLEEDDYMAQLETLLVEIARVDQRLRDLRAATRDAQDSAGSQARLQRQEAAG